MMPMISPFTTWLITKGPFVTQRLSGWPKAKAAAKSMTARMAGATRRKVVSRGVAAQSAARPTGPSAAPVMAPTKVVSVVSRLRCR